jgi:AcrR family transcriptional regulator
MPPRAYNNEMRQLQQADLKARIAEAAAQLHATQGVLATSYAQVAQQAGVSLPTVYKHFPTLGELIQACSGHVASQAPAFPQERLLDAPDLASAAEVLVEALDRQHAHFEPWLDWREHRSVPALAALAERNREQLLGVCRSVLQRHGAPGDAAATAAVWESLLAFDFWQRLVRAHRLGRTAARARQRHLLLAAAGPAPAADPSPRPTRKARP